MTITKRDSKRTNSQGRSYKKNIEIIVADGVFTYITNDLSHLLFYTDIPFLKEGKNNGTDIGKKEMLQVEIRMSTRHLQGMVENILEDINKKLKQKNDNETATSNMEMFV